MRARTGVAVAACAAAMLYGCAAPGPAPVTERKPPPARPAAPPPPPPAAVVTPAPAEAAPPKAAPPPEVVVKPLRPADTRPEFHTVRKGDTLYSIAVEHGVDWRELVVLNRLDNPNVIRIGQSIRLRAAEEPAVALAAPPPALAEPKPLAPPVPVAPAAADDGVRTEPRALRRPFTEKLFAQLQGKAAEPRTEVVAVAPRTEPAAEVDKLDWLWPTAGKLIERFSDSNRGIDIAGRLGQDVLASAAGRVVYSGSGIRGLGRLVIIKHSDAYVSVYAHNRDILVKEGQEVARGQRIATLGDTDTDRPRLHFEIRRFGRPVDPLRYLVEP
jgi:lipoprotein NlpD